MRSLSVLAVVVVGVAVAQAACSKDPPPPQVPMASAQPSFTAPPPQPSVQPTVAPGQLATPGPTALSCSNDSQCLFHHCNMQYQKCAFPCISDNDCIQGATCMVVLGPAALCIAKSNP